MSDLMKRLCDPEYAHESSTLLRGLHGEAAQRIAELEAALAASQKALRELREQGAPCALWDDIEAANLKALAIS